MNISENLNRIINGKASIRQSIIGKGVDVPESALIDAYSEYIDAIEQGGGGEEVGGIEDELIFEIHSSSVSTNPCFDFYGDYIAAKNVRISTDDGATWQSIASHRTRCYFNGSNKLILRYIPTQGYVATNTNATINSVEETSKFKVSGRLRNAHVPYQYNVFFYGNNNIVDCSELLIETEEFGQYACQKMFNNCKVLEKAPKIKGFAANARAFSYMFSNCTYLKDVQDIDVITLKGDYPMEFMFEKCALLINAPEINVLSLDSASGAMRNMFLDCTSLVNPPSILHPTSLGSSCYMYMFKGCRLLAKSPILPAYSATASSCYTYMFQNCTSLQNIECYAQKINFNNWLNGAKQDGVFVCGYYTNTTTSGVNGVPATMSIERKNRFDANVLKIVSDEEPNVDVIISVFMGDSSNLEISYFSYSTDGGETWTLHETDEMLNVTIRGNDELLIKGLVSLGSSSGYYSISSNLTKFKVYGDIYESTPRMFKCLFESSKITEANINFHCTTFWIQMCYQMFKDCKLLKSAPNFDIIKYIDSEALEYCFQKCSELVDVPNFTINCFSEKQSQLTYAFSECVKLTDSNLIVNADTISAYGFSNAFSGCSSLTKTPKIRAKKAKMSCFGSAFGGCSKLTDIDIKISDSFENNAFAYAFRECTELEDASNFIITPEPNDNTFNYAFYKCTSLKKSPQMNFKTIASGGLNFMFEQCSKLEEVTLMSLQPLSSIISSDWMRNVNPNPITFYLNADETWSDTIVRGSSTLPSNAIIEHITM